MRDWAASCASIRACRYRLLPEASSGCSRCTSGIGNAPWPKGIHDVPNGESILRTNLCARHGPSLGESGCPTVSFDAASEVSKLEGHGLPPDDMCARKLTGFSEMRAT